MSTPPDDVAYDYIVVGSGAGGAPAAARLAEAGYRVLVLEQGLDQPSAFVDVPLLSGAASEEKGTSKHYFVRHFEDDALARRDWKYKYKQELGIAYPRAIGRVGGCTQVNVQVWVRADDVDWERYAACTGDGFWRAENMRRVLQLVERCEYRPLLKLLDRIGRMLGIRRLRNRRGHGFSGYIETTRSPLTLLFEDRQLLIIALKTALYSRRLGGWRDQLKRLLALYDPNDDRAQGTEGLTWTPQTITRQGRRSGGVRDRLLAVQKAHPDRLTIRTGATVANIVLDDNNTAVGARYTDANGRTHEESARKEVLLAAGAFETPAILMRSGIGPRGHLEQAGIAPVRVDNGAVGKYLHDRYEIGVISKMKRPFALLDGVKFDVDKDSHYAQWLRSGRGVYASNGVVIGFQKKSSPELDDPDLYIFCLPAAIRGYYLDYFRDTVKDPYHLTWLVLHENKGDRDGTVRLDTANAAGPPAINFHYHQHDDSGPLVTGVKAAREVTASYADLVECEEWPRAEVSSDEALRVEIESNTWGHHANGSARMGARDAPGAVVDGDLKVIGCRGLRVCDASVFPHTPGSFVASAVVQVGEAAAIKAIAEARGQDPEALLREMLARA